MTAKPETPRTPAQMAAKINAAGRGDERALEDVIRHYQDRVARYVVLQVGRDTADFDDLCQVVFVKMALSLARLRSVDAFEPWLFRIARNVCCDHLRRRRIASLFVPLSHDHDAVAAPPEALNGLGVLDRALEKLSRSQRELIGLLRDGAHSYEELGRLTNSSARAVAGRLFRARARLRRLLTSTEPSSE